MKISCRGQPATRVENLHARKATYRRLCARCLCGGDVACHRPSIPMPALLASFLSRHQPHKNQRQIISALYMSLQGHEVGSHLYEQLPINSCCVVLTLLVSLLPLKECDVLPLEPLLLEAWLHRTLQILNPAPLSLAQRHSICTLSLLLPSNA